MRGKLLLLVGVGVGYVLGTRAGRERYDAMKKNVTKIWHDPRVQTQVKNAEQFAKDKAPDVVDFVSDNAKKVVSQVRGKTTAKTAPAKPVASKTPSTTE
ncbi:MAG: hypothetical protein JWO10_2166 [Microbacteriaceae bacterium]|jgi:hypothetical protein|nr:hypothetical protein [Microbacteriaceae bacterium]